jgi:glutamate/tyrosine decarboxylase-like PLP-dependent enzyme
MKKTNPSSKDFAELLHQQRENIFQNLKTDLHGPNSLAGWFLGPKAENADLFKKLINQALEKHIKDRESLYEDDPEYVTKEIKESEEYKKTVEVLEQKATALFDQLKSSVPFWSYRWLSHMNWDTTLPGMLGYFGTMLYNPNNVAAEASPVTTLLEMKVGDELSEMLGYNINDNHKPRAWGHITCDGSIANNEAMWAARNLKFYPVSIVQAIEQEEKLALAKNLDITMPNGQKKKLHDLSFWEQLNLGVDEILSIPKKIKDTCNISLEEIADLINKYSIQNLGFDGVKSFMNDDIKEPVVMSPSHMHYSWPKSAAVLGIGANNVKNIEVDLDARMRIDKLREEIDLSIKEKQPIIMVVAVIGSTEESAIDPLKEIIKLRKEYNKDKNIDFVVHCDAAWGGYFASILKEPKVVKQEENSRKPNEQYTPALVMSKYVTEQYENLQYSDSITIDPHKAGYVPYPAGGLCYRNSAMRNMVTFTAPVVYHGGVDPTVGVYGLEGSKPGAAPAGVYLSHQVIPLDKTGYGKILAKCLFNSKRLYSAFITMAEEDDDFIIVPLQRLPAEKKPDHNEASIKKERELIKEQIVNKTNEEMMNNQDVVKLLPELGSDQTIITYAFNFKNNNGELNTDTDKANEFNLKIFQALSLSPNHDDVSKVPMMITQSQFTVDGYGKDFVDVFKSRLRVSDDNDTPVTFLISTTMNPWLTETSKGHVLINELTNHLRNKVIEQVKAMNNC